MLRREGLGRVAEEGVRVVAEERVEVGARAHGTHANRRVRKGPGGAVGADGGPGGGPGGGVGCPLHDGPPSRHIFASSDASRPAAAHTLDAVGLRVGARRLERAETMNVLESRTGRPCGCTRGSCWSARAVVDRGGPRPHPRFVVTEAFRFRRRAQRERHQVRLGVGRLGDGQLLPEGHEPGRRARRTWRRTRPSPLTFSKPVSLHQAAPALTPAIAGKWVQTNPTTLSYALDSPLIPSSQEVVTIPGGAHGLRSTDGATLPSLAHRRLRCGRRRHAPAAAAPGPAQLPAGGLRPERTRPDPRRPGRGPGRVPSRGAGPACPRSSPPSGPRAPPTRSPRRRSRPSRPRTTSASTGSPVPPCGRR